LIASLDGSRVSDIGIDGTRLYKSPPEVSREIGHGDAEILLRPRPAMAGKRRAYDQTTTAEPHSNFKTGDYAASASNNFGASTQPKSAERIAFR
jgi:hypothetical protein